MQPDVLSDDDVRAFLRRYLDAWNAHRADAVLALAGADVTWFDPTIPGGSARGHEPVRAWLTAFWRTFPDMTFAPLLGDGGDLLASALLTPDRRTLSAPWRCEGSMLGPIDPPGLPATGRRISLTGVDLYTFRGGRLATVRTITDLQEALRQAGLLPSQGSLAERGLAFAARAATRLLR